MRHVLGVIVENHPGVLSRVAGLFSRRGFNIESLTVGITEDPRLSRMTIVIDGDDRVVEQVDKQLQKLVDVLKVVDLSPHDSVSRELCLVKVAVEPEDRSRVREIADIFRARIVDVSRRSMVMEITGDREKIEAMLELLREYGIRDMVRTGEIAILRGSGKSEKGESDDGQDVLRWRRRPKADSGQEGRDSGIR